MYFVGALGAAVLLGLPALFVLRAAGMVNWGSTLLVGAAIGGVIGWNSPRAKRAGAICGRG
jgi:hypothetical protein